MTVLTWRTPVFIRSDMSQCVSPSGTGARCSYFARAIAARGVVVTQASPGTTLPAHTTASGKVLLGHLPDKAALREMLHGNLPRLTAQTIVAEDQLSTEVESVRTAGMAVSREETVPGIDSLAVLIRGVDGRIVAALGVSLPAGRLDPFLATFRRKVIVIASAITADVRRESSDGLRSTVGGLALEV